MAILILSRWVVKIKNKDHLSLAKASHYLLLFKLDDSHQKWNERCSILQEAQLSSLTSFGPACLIYFLCTLTYWYSQYLSMNPPISSNCNCFMIFTTDIAKLSQVAIQLGPDCLLSNCSKLLKKENKLGLSSVTSGGETFLD